MKRTKWETYKELELIPDSMWDAVLKEAKSHHRASHSWLDKLWELIVNAITTGSEPVIREVYDRNGFLSWHVYDPITSESLHFSSETEVVAWLERRYYRRGLA